MDGGDEQAFLRSLDISANLNQEVRVVEEDVVLFQKQIFDLHCYFDGGWEGDVGVGCAKTPMVLLSKWGWSPPQDGGHFGEV